MVLSILRIVGWCILGDSRDCRPCWVTCQATQCSHTVMIGKNATVKQITCLKRPSKNGLKTCQKLLTTYYNVTQC